MPIPQASPSRRFVRTWLAPAAVVLTVAVPVGGALAAPGRGEDRAAEPAFQNGGYCADAEERAFLDLLNDYRAANGRGPVQLSQTLGAAAESHSAEMANNGYFDHTMLGGVGVGENLRNHGYRDATYGENIAAGQGSAAGVFSQWRNSASHNANMLSANFDAVGVARAYDPNSGYGWYWTTIYGGTADAPAAGCGETPSAARSEPTPEPTPEPTATAIPSPTAEPTLEPVATEPQVEATVAAVLTAAPVPSATPAAEPLAIASPPSETAAAATADLNLRAGPGIEYPTLTTVPSGAVLTVTGPAATGYLPVTADGRFGWVAADFVAFQGVTAQPVAAPSPEAEAEAEATVPSAPAATPAAAVAPAPVAGPPVTADGTATTASELLLRAGPSSAEAVLLVVPAGEALTLTGEASGGFLGVSYGGQTGWADAAYLTS